MKLFIASSLILTLLSCSVLPSKPIRNEHLNNFAKYCYKGIENDIAQFTGEETTNCGFYDWFDQNTTNFDLENGVKCAKEAYEKDKPFKFGDFNILGDSYVCQVYASNAEGSILKIFLDHDSSGALTINSDSVILNQKKCREPKFAESGIYVDKVNCIDIEK